MLRLSFALLACVMCLQLFAQTYTMSNATINTCSGSFYDSGGSGGTYVDNQNLTMTFCSSTPGANIVIDFTSFDVEATYDFLTVYDGPNIVSPLIGSYSGIIAPATITSSNGCLTFLFTSDFSISQGGWAANISCAQPCQDVITSAAFNPAPNGDGVIYLCTGEALTMDGFATYPNNGAGYTQSDASSIFEWSTQDVTNDTGQNTTHVFNSAGAYLIELEVTDVNGCESNNSSSQLVYVGTSPIFSDSPSNPSLLCEGAQGTLFGIANEVEFTQNCSPPPPPYLALPDGNGVSYSTSISQDCFGPGQTLDNLNDLLDICINIEHSWMGDLDIVIECPSGEQITLVDYPTGGGTFLGVPVDNDATPSVQGIGYDYCWTATATNGSWANNIAPTLPAGTYAPASPFTGLLGCEMNGDWTLIIVDNLPSDNGFIFNWGINFNPTLYPPPATFTPNIISSTWQSNPSIIAGSNPIIIQPVSSGNLCFDYEVTDDFGCTYDTSYCIDVLPISISTDIQNSCGDFTWIDGNTYNTNNNSATWVLTNSLGCDSTVTLDLTINSNTGLDLQSACDSYTWIDGVTYTSSNNSSTWVLTNQAGCDSTVTLDLTLTNSTVGSDIQTHCDSYTWIDGNTYSSSNNSAIWVLNNAVGCDSIVTLDLTITNPNAGTDVQVACNAYTWIDGNSYTSSNNSATWVLANAAGCDSTVTLDLTITNANTGTDSQTACDSYTWIDGNTYLNNNNSATWVLSNVDGCDSTVTLDLNILSSTSGIDSQAACDSYIWIDGNTYTTSNNSATWILTNSAGCDSIVTLDLVITNSTYGIDTQIACDSYTWIDGNEYVSSNNSATWYLTNAAGCDSTVTLDLTITNSNNGSDIQMHCDSYIWIDGNTYTSSNSSATWVLTSAAGCDSTVTLDLTIINSNTGIDIQTVCDSYTWIDGNTYTESNNIATWILTNTSGCDSTVTLDLTIINSNSGIDTQVACDSYIWIDGLTYTESNNTATWILSNTEGCDSTVTLNLTVNYTPNFSVSGTDPSVCNASDGSILISGLSASASYVLNYDSLSMLSQTFTTMSNSFGEILLSDVGAGLYTDFSLSFEGCPFLSPQIIDLNNPGAPVIDNQLDSTVCDVFVLLDISGSNLSGNQSYYTELDAQGVPLYVGDTIIETQTIYLYDITGLCADQSNFTVTVNNTPTLVDPGSQEVCESYSLPLSIVGTNLSGDQNYYNDSQNNGGGVISSALSSSQVVYIYDANGLCSDEVSFQVTIHNNPDLVSFSGGNIYCEGEIIQPLTAQVEGLSVFVIEYTVDNINSSISSSNGLFNFGNEAGEYTLTVLSDNHCSTLLNESQSIVINALPQGPILSNGYNYCINDVPEPIFVSGSSGNYNWFADASLTNFITSGESLIPSIISGDTYYYVSATENGCEGPSSFTVVSFQICDITIPTAFTPDNDLVNDFWELVNIDLVYPSNIVQVFNRWGNKIYESNEGAYNEYPWDGTYNGEVLPVGSYYYVIDYNDDKTDSTTGIVSIIK